MNYTKFDLLKIKTNNTTLLWKETRGIAPNDVSLKFDNAMLKWQNELTDALEIWINKGGSMTEGELILARVNLGTVVESWLKLFYCAYYNDYCKMPITDKYNNMIEPEKASFEQLKVFSTGKLWENSQSKDYVWVESVQRKRNAIHAFNYKDIGTNQEFLDDVDYLYEFVENIISHLPPLEDFIETYPSGYIHISSLF